MAKYMNAILTNEGYRLLFDAIKQGSRVDFSSLAVGAGLCNGRTKKQTVNNIRQMTSLVDERLRVDFDSIIYNDNFIMLEATISNNDDTQDYGYNITEIGVFATDGTSSTEKLYAVVLPEGEYNTSIQDFDLKSDYMPPYDENSTFEYKLQINLVLTDGEGA